MTAPRILIVEDEGIVVMDIRRQLTRMGYEVVGDCATGEEAIRLATRLHPDLVLMDIRLRGAIDGITAAEVIRRESVAPVVYLTAHTDDATLQRARVTEPFGYLLKPFEERELRTTIEMAVYKHEAERRLRASERRYAATLSSIGDAVVATDDQAIVSFLNPVAEKQTGWNATEAIGKPLHEVFRIVNEDTREPVVSPVDRVLRDGTVVGLANHTILISRDGTELPIDDCASPIHDDHGAIRGAVLVFRDVTDARRAEAALRESEARFRLMADATPAMIWVTGPDGACSFVNQTWAVFTGRHPEQDTGDGWLESVHPDDRDRARDSFRLAVQRRDRFEMEYRLRRHDGPYRWVIDQGVPRFGAVGEFLGHVGSAIDVTDHRQMEEQLRQAVKMEAIGHLAGGVAHDFNNLLTAINGYASLLLESVGADHPWHGFVQSILRAGDRAADLTRQLLAFARKQMLQTRVIDLNAVILNTRNMLERLIDENIEVRAELDPALRPIRADPGQIDQVIVNLAVNARDAMPEGGLLSIQSENVTLGDSAADRALDLAAGAYVRVTIRDTGTGMDEATRARIFEPFFTTKEQGKGTGLGLATVYGIVKQMGGAIVVRSQMGKGTTFTIFFPAVAEALAPPSPAAHTNLPGGTETILLVEDEAMLRSLGRHVLQTCGYVVMEACNGVDALQLITGYQGPLDLLVTDVVMPQMGGRALADLLTSQRPGLRVLFVSGYAESGTLIQGGRAGVYGFLQKPFTPAALAGQVRSLLDRNE